MEIVKQYGDFTKTEIFNLSQGKGEALKKQPDGMEFTIDRLLIIKDVANTKNGEEPKERDIMHIITKDGRILSLEAPTVQDTIKKAIDFLETHELTFRLFRSESKSGRIYMNVELL